MRSGAAGAGADGVKGSALGGSGSGRVLHPARATAATRLLNFTFDADDRRTLTMWLIVLEALAALCLLVGIVWWTMFSGRRRGEPDDSD